MRKQTKRKIWRTDLNPIKFAIEGASITPDELLNPLRHLELGAIENFRTGAATTNDWHAINGLQGLCEVLANSGVGPEALPAAMKAQEALVEAKHRYEKTGKMGTSGPGLVAFRDLYEYHDLQRQSIPRSQYERAIQRAANLINSKSPKVRVL